ncbi:MAG: histidine--tRNA ligase [Pseudomonadota bacterium]
MSKLQAVRGMHDILMHDTPRWQFLENNIKSILTQYSYQEIRLPIVEKTELFKRSIGDNTDIVSKEMYSFDDRNDTSLTLRPEGTASCVRAGIEHGLFHNQTQRLWYTGPMFRHERPQKGRQRQFHQIGVEAFGFNGPDIDAEQILMCARIWEVLKLDGISLEINSLGTAESRSAYRSILIDYFSSHKEQLDKDSKVRLAQNPLRILDSKNPDMQSLIQAAPTMDEHLDTESADHFSGLKEILDGANVQYSVNPRLVRGLDYYGKTVFEWISNQLGAQGTVCAGGRYDGLVEQHGASPTAAVGFAMGLERLLELASFDSMPDSSPHIYLLISGEKAIKSGMLLAEQIRIQLPGIRLLSHCGGGSLKSQFKKADKSGAQLALILGEDELENNQLTVKYLRNDKPQTMVKWLEIASFLSSTLSIPAIQAK